MAGFERTDLSIIVYAPPLVPGDARPAAIVRAMERAFPGVSLGWTVGEDHQMRRLTDRDMRACEDGTFPLACNGDERYPVMVSGWACPSWWGPAEQAPLEVHARVPADAAGCAAAGTVLGSIGDAARGFWGHATPYAASITIARQRDTSPLAVFAPEPPPLGLPSLRNPMVLPPELPHSLGWVNYWSAAAARAVGFPDPERDAELLTRARSTPAGGWLLRLTDAPLDLDNRAHLDTLLRAYERFPVIGGRAGGQFAEPRGRP